MSDPKVDEFVRTKVPEEYRDVVEALRALVRETAPEAEEKIAYGIPAYKARKIFAVINPYKEGVTFAFTHGMEFEDRYGLLKGRGKVGRHVKIRGFSEVNREALKEYIRQALEIDSR